MPKLPIISGREIIKIAQKIGFETIRQHGSHVILRNTQHVRLTIPLHDSLKPGTLLQILKTLQITKKELEKLV